MHEAVEGQARDSRPASAPVGLRPRLPGSGVSVTVHDVPEPVSAISPDGLFVSYQPKAVHVVDGHTTDPRLAWALALAGSGASAAVHDVPEPVISSPCRPDDNVSYQPAAVHEVVVGHATELR